MWVKPEMRDEIVMHIQEKVKQSGLSEKFMLKVLDIYTTKFSSWKKRLNQPNKHNGSQPRDYWLEEWEKDAMTKFYQENESEGYRRCCYLMIDKDIVYTSPSTVYRTLKKRGVMTKNSNKVSTKGDGFVQPTTPHEHWHMDISYVKIGGVFYYLISILDGYSRAIVSWDLRREMKDSDVGIVQQKAKEQYPNEYPRYITDNGSQFISKDFKQFIALNSLTHWTTSPYYPQSNGKIERWHRSIKDECIKLKTPLTIDDAKRIIENYIYNYNHVRLHSAIGYIAPLDKMLGNDLEIIKERKKKVDERRKERKNININNHKLTEITN